MLTFQDLKTGVTMSVNHVTGETMPENMPRIVDYGTPLAKAFPSVDTVIRVERRRNDYGRITEWTLSHRTRGYTSAGACLRWQDCDVWRVTTFIDNATHGQAFKTPEQAETYLAQRGELIERLS